MCKQLPNSPNGPSWLRNANSCLCLGFISLWAVAYSKFWRISCQATCQADNCTKVKARNCMQCSEAEVECSKRQRITSAIVKLVPTLDKSGSCKSSVFAASFLDISISGTCSQGCTDMQSMLQRLNPYRCSACRVIPISIWSMHGCDAFF